MQERTKQSKADTFLASIGFPEALGATIGFMVADNTSLRIAAGISNNSGAAHEAESLTAGTLSAIALGGIIRYIRSQR